MQAPDFERQHSDIIDLFTTASKKPKVITGDDNLPKEVMEIDSESLWWKLHNINSNTFGRAAYEIVDFKQCADMCFFFMSAPRAQIMRQQILAKDKTYRYSLDAKSSETVLDSHNRQANMIDKVNRNKIEKHIKVTGDEAKKGFMNGMGFSNGQDEREG